MAKKIDTPKTVSKKHIARSQREQRQTRIILIVTGAILAVILGLLIYALVDTYLVKPNKSVAYVDNYVIKAGDYKTKVKYARVNTINQAYTYYQYSQMFGSYGSSYLTAAQNMITELFDPTSVGERVLDSMIDEHLISEEAEKLGITVSEEEIDKAMQIAFEFFPNGTNTPTITSTAPSTPTLSDKQLTLLAYTDTPTATATATNTPEGWEPTNTATLVPTNAPTQEPSVAETKGSNETQMSGTATPEPTATITPTPTPYTTQGYSKAISSYLDSLGTVNLSKEELRDIFRNQLLREKMLAAITADLEPVEDQVWARHILVDSEEKAIEIRERLENGEDWASLVATENNETPDSVTMEDLGWFGVGQMEESFEKAAFALEDVGQLTEPIQTSYGWHVIQLIAKGPIDLDSNQFQTLKESNFDKWLLGLREAKSDVIKKVEGWEELVPNTPEVPSDFLSMLFSASQ